MHADRTSTEAHTAARDRLREEELAAFLIDDETVRAVQSLELEFGGGLPAVV